MQGHDVNPGRPTHAVNHSYGIPSFPLTIPRAEMQCLFSSDPTGVLLQGDPDLDGPVTLTKARASFQARESNIYSPPTWTHTHTRRHKRVQMQGPPSVQQFKPELLIKLSCSPRQSLGDPLGLNGCPSSVASAAGPQVPAGKLRDSSVSQTD